MRRLAWFSLALCFGADEAGKILRPAPQSSFAAGATVDVVATVPKGGRIELDGVALTLETPFPDVYRGKLQPAPGEHKLAVIWEENRREVVFSMGARAGFTAFRHHPPAGETPCTQCHELSKRGRFRFKGGCSDCHAVAAFAQSHKPHNPEVLAECGLCHNAHGSTVKGHLLRSKEQVCQSCHN